MNKIRFFAAATALCFTTQGFAADLIVMSDDAPDTSALNSQIYVQLLGGVALPHDVTFYLGTDVDAVDPTVPGYAVAGTLGVVVYDGLSVEADLLHTFRDEEADGGDTYATTSLMANLKYTAHLNDMFSVYGAVGVGHIWLSNFDGPPVSETFELSGWGYQLIAGVGAQVTENVSVVGEYRYQDTFNPYEIGGDANMTVPTSSVLAGVKIGF